MQYLYFGPHTFYPLSDWHLQQAKAWDRAREAYEMAAKCSQRQESPWYAAKHLEKAAEAARETQDWGLFIDYLKQASLAYREAGRPQSAAEALAKGAKMLEDKDPEVWNSCFDRNNCQNHHAWGTSTSPTSTKDSTFWRGLWIGLIGHRASSMYFKPRQRKLCLLLPCPSHRQNNSQVFPTWCIIHVATNIQAAGELLAEAIEEVESDGKLALSGDLFRQAIGELFCRQGLAVQCMSPCIWLAETYQLNHYWSSKELHKASLAIPVVYTHWLSMFKLPMSSHMI